jgi:hypothetical protein
MVFELPYEKALVNTWPLSTRMFCFFKRYEQLRTSFQRNFEPHQAGT